MDKKNFLELLDKYLDGTASAVEGQLVEDYYQRLSETNSTALPEEKEHALEQKMLQHIRNGMYTMPAPLVKRKMWRPAFAVAASVLLVIAAGWLLLKKDVPHQKVAVKNKTAAAPDIAPGRNTATLTLADGSRIVLDDANNGILAIEGAATVTKTKDGQLTYVIKSNGATDAPPVYNTIATPYGGQYQVVLPDGTKAYLNAGSTLTYPTVFAGGERKVMLKGEAYFDVAQNKALPFRVEAGAQTVEVLGTQFNIMAYEDEATVNTTLLQGAVKIIKGNKSKTLRPGEQSVVKGEDIAVGEADLGAVLAWKDGYFVFKNEDLNSIMRKITRWYNVEVKYEGHSGKKSFGGKISRSRNVSDVLKMLELTGSIRFTIEDAPSGKQKRIIVMP